jgi:hypothetical protein
LVSDNSTTLLYGLHVESLPPVAFGSTLDEILKRLTPRHRDLNRLMGLAALVLALGLGLLCSFLGHVEAALCGNPVRILFAE